MQFNQTNNNAGDVKNGPPWDDCDARAWKAIVETYKLIRDSTSDEHKYDEYCWHAISRKMEEFIVL